MKNGGNYSNNSINIMLFINKKTMIKIKIIVV